jgi:hypothetical protein
MIDIHSGDLPEITTYVGALSSKQGNASTRAGSRRPPPIHLPEPPRGGFGLTNGFECRGIAALIDTGASVSMVEASIPALINAEVHVPDRNQLDIIRTAEGEPMDLTGYIKVCLVIGKGVYPHNFYVRGRQHLSSGTPKKFDMIIGVDLLDKIGSCMVDFKRGEVTFRDPELRSTYIYKLNPNENRLIIRCNAGQTWSMGDALNLPTAPRAPRLPSKAQLALEQAAKASTSKEDTFSSTPAESVSRRHALQKANTQPTTWHKTGASTPAPPSSNKEASRKEKIAILQAKYNKKASSPSVSEDEVGSPTAKQIHATSIEDADDTYLVDDWEFIQGCLNEIRLSNQGVG